jgi:hypothetical protein
MATAPGLELNLVSLEQPRKTAHPFVMDAEVCSSKNSWTSSRRAISPAFIRSCKVYKTSSFIRSFLEPPDGFVSKSSASRPLSR